MTKDEILTLYSYCQTHGIRKVDRLKELGISYYNYNKSRKQYFKADGTEISEGNFIAITPQMSPINLPNNRSTPSTQRRNRKKEDQLAQGNILTDYSGDIGSSSLLVKNSITKINSNKTSINI